MDTQVPLNEREVPADVQNMVVDVSNAMAQIVNEVMHFASEQPDGGPGGHTIAVVCMAACEMVIGILVDNYALDSTAEETIRKLARRVYEETKKNCSVTAQRIDKKAEVPN